MLSPLANQAYERILEMIQKGELPAGARVTERELAARLGVSRTPVREALAMLGEHRIVNRLRGEAYFVQPLDLARLSEISAVRGVLEGYAARLFCRTASDAEMDILADLAERVEEAAAAGDVTRMHQTDAAFHRFLVERCGNRELANILTSTNLLTMFVFSLPPFGDEVLLSEPQGIVGRHRELVQALRRRDPHEAEMAMREHASLLLRDRQRELKWLREARAS